MQALLFKQIIEATAVSPILAPGTIRRALSDIGRRPEEATSDDYRRALPRIEARLRAYLSEPEVKASMARVRHVIEVQ